MKKYTDIKNTPLKFHTFYSRVVLPLDAFVNISNLMVLLMEITGKGFQWTSLIGVAVSVLFIVLCFAAFRNLIYFRKAGLYSVWGLLLLQVGNGVYNMWLYSQVQGLEVMAVAFVLTILILLMIFLYYFKRRDLFTKDGLTYEELMRLKGKTPVNFHYYGTNGYTTSEFAEKFQKAQASYVPPVVEEEEEEVGEYDCPRCGHHITDGAVFCPKCGAQTRAVRR